MTDSEGRDVAHVSGVGCSRCPSKFAGLTYQGEPICIRCGWEIEDNMPHTPSDSSTGEPGFCPHCGNGVLQEHTTDCPEREE